ncbi:5-hydroxytryptamine receptor 3A [Merluccius polli]|uniref:5-hydroxytryptamine receptor 3A n=1 Tax=Merluccius polli TaxID=89951 RepID=A0AA47M658_MERPO|nr:5-hydroxytryptamine receptor 3A [Merluccius polli]
MKRRPVLYIVNFLLPIWFFMCLDVASLFISEKGGEKLSFKVTVMLSVMVLQLILNDILPSTSNKIPLTATYITTIFALMLLSLLETILVMHLMEKDSRSQENGETDCRTAKDFDRNKDLPTAHKGNKG